MLQWGQHERLSPGSRPPYMREQTHSHAPRPPHLLLQPQQQAKDPHPGVVGAPRRPTFNSDPAPPPFPGKVSYTGLSHTGK